MNTERYEQNFGSCELGDRRLNRRALSIGQALSKKIGEGLSSVFASAKELKRAYAFSLIRKLTLKSSSNLIVR
ncbi:MAG: hypothetical protein F6K11_36835 [Leptolyngbya sp. SIO3F4]|nr:hypothetical protein [Leptolyngbya sp. SIO3F4]